MSEFDLLPIAKATWETTYMVFIASFISIVLGLALGAVIYMTGKRQPLENALCHRMLGVIINITRSIPFIILMILLIPLTRLIVGTTIGTNSALVPLTIAAIPFYSRIAQNAFAEVSYGLVEAGYAMGSSPWQIITKIIIPESLSSLIRGGTLLIIGLIGYSAMAGVVGGGGLGELAINYGYQRFDVIVMFETVVVLIIMVQLVQVIGDWFAKKRATRAIINLSIVLWLACMAYQFWPATLGHENIIRVGVMTGQPEKIMKIAQTIAKNKYGVNLQIVSFNDYVQPNVALNNHSIDANIFQHAPYLENQMKARHYLLTPIARTFVYPMGFYSQKIKQLSELKENAIIALPNDPSNEGRSLLLLQKAGLIALRAGVGTLATVNDITANPQHLQFKLLDAAQLPRVLHDADLVAITNDFIAPTGLSLKQAVIKEGSDSPYANLIVVREKDKANPLLQKLITIMHSPAIISATEDAYPNGAAIPAWKLTNYANSLILKIRQ